MARMQGKPSGAAGIDTISDLRRVGRANPIDHVLDPPL